MGRGEKIGVLQSSMGSYQSELGSSEDSIGLEAARLQAAAHGAAHGCIVGQSKRDGAPNVGTQDDSQTEAGDVVGQLGAL